MATRSNSFKKSVQGSGPDTSKGGPLAKLSSTPKSEIPLKSGSSLKKSASSRFSEGSTFALEKLPSFKDISPNLRTELLLRKLKQCVVCFDFTDPESEMKSKEIKKESLLQCVEYLVSNREALTESVYIALFNMVSINLFRPLPPHVNPYGLMYDPEEDEPILEAAWSHIQIVYELFLRFIDAPDFNTQIAKSFIDQKFVLQLLELFDSEDPRERDYLKTTLHRIYGKFLPLRGFVRTAIRDLFCTFVYESGHHNGVAEILEVLGSIINGFAVPLKEEHKQFLSRVLMPLHKPKNLSLYNTQLTYCICQFLDKEPQLIEAVFRLLMRMWPLGNSPKEVLFISEIEELLNTIDGINFNRVRIILFKKVAQCFASEHFQVAERALYLWSNDHIVSLVADNLSDILPLIFSALYNNAYHHWNKTIRSLSLGSLQLFQEIDGNLYTTVCRQYLESQAHQPAKVKPTPKEERMNKPQAMTDTNSPKPQEGPHIRRKSLLPVDPNTLAALTDHRSLEDIILNDDEDSNYDGDSQTDDMDADMEDSFNEVDDTMDEEEDKARTAGYIRSQIRST